MERLRRIFRLTALVALPALLLGGTGALGAPTLSAQQSLLLETISAKQAKIASLQETSRAIALRLEISRQELVRLRTSLDRAEHAVDTQQDSFNERLVNIYKSGGGFQFALLSNARDLNDFLIRMRLLSTIADADQRVLTGLKTQKLNVAQAKQRAEEIEQQQTEMLRLQDSELSQLKVELAQEKKLLARVSAKLKAILAARRRAQELARKAEARRSKPSGSAIEAVWATVDRYPAERFLTAYDNPTAFKATGVKESGTASWYGGDDGFNGKPTSSGETFNDQDFTAAHKTLPLGTYLAVWHGGRRIIVRINDRGPFIPGRFLDLSKRAAEELGIGGLGEVRTEIVSPK